MEERLMKKHIISLAILLASGVSVFGQNTTYLSEIRITDRQVVKTSDRQVNVKMEVSLDELDIKRQHSLRVVPVILSADGTQERELPPFVINGKVRDKVQQRMETLDGVSANPDAVVTVRRKNGSSQVLSYDAAVPFQRWMIGGNIQLRGYVTGCALCDDGDETATTGDILPEMTPEYYSPVMKPKEEIVKRRSETRSARVQFRQNSSNIRPDYKNNRAELDTVSNSIELVKKNTDVRIIGIYITGYASPEGSMAHNMALSENRAKAVADYIRRYDAIAPEMLHVDWKGEDWEGFVRVLGDFPNLLKRDEVYEIIERYPDERDFCELQLQKLVPPTIYHRLLTEIYPALRRNEYRIEYNVRNFNLEEARRMVDERPDLLSLSEMYKVADSYGKGTPGYDKVMATALRYFPASPSALNENAVNAISREEYAKAVELLEKSEVTARSAELLSTLGVAYAGAGQYDKAEDVFRRASEAGSATARHNLEEVRQVIDQL